MKYSIVLRLSVLLFLSACITLTAQSESKLSAPLQKIIQLEGDEAVLKAWIFFSDKGAAVPSKLAAAEDNLTPRARQRRLRHFQPNSLVDFKDIPVNREYIDQVKLNVEKIRHKSRWLNAVSVEASGKSISQIETLPFVEKIDVVREGRMPLPEPQEAELPSATRQLEMTQLDYGPSFAQNNQISTIALHDSGYDGSGVLICMLDAGFNNIYRDGNNPGHESLRHLKILYTYDFVNGDSAVWDEPGQMGNGNHGTYTLSAMAGFKEGQLIGPAYGAEFILAKTENTDWERHIEEDHWIAGAEWADSLGADIISSSLGYRDGFAAHGELDYTWEDMDGNTTIVTVGAEIAASKGILVVNSAGNEGPSGQFPNTLVAPADGAHVLAVGAVDASGIRTSFSSMGPTADGRIKPDVMARGLATVCASPNDTSAYTTSSGTSLSCPLAAGAAALILQVNPTWTNLQIIQALKNTASNASAPNNSYGWGIINAYNAAFNIIPFTGSFALKQPYPNPMSPFNSTANIDFNLSAAGHVRISVYNTLGQRVAVLLDEFRNEGPYTDVKWDATGMASGVYFVMLKADQGKQVRKVLLIK